MSVRLQQYAHAGSTTREDCDSSRVVERESRQHPVFDQRTSHLETALSKTRSSGARLKGSAILSCECPESEAVAFMDQTHCLVIRGIADCADSQENQMWHPYAVGTTADFAQRLLLIIEPSPVAAMGID